MNKIVIFFIAGLVIFFSCGNKETKFTACSNPDNKIIQTWNSKSYYNNKILVENWPKDSIALYKMMIHYIYDNKSTIDSLINIKDMDIISFVFFKSNSKTKAVLNGKEDDYGFLKNHLGYMNFRTSSSFRTINCGKWILITSRNLGYAVPSEYPRNYPAYSDIVLDDRCDPQFYEKHKDNEIVRYYHELFYPNNSTIGKQE